MFNITAVQFPYVGVQNGVGPEVAGKTSCGSSIQSQIFNFLALITGMPVTYSFGLIPRLQTIALKSAGSWLPAVAQIVKAEKNCIQAQVVKMPDPIKS